jgi:hypothetical protein
MSGDRTTSSRSVLWMSALVSLLGAFEVLMALGAGSGLTRVVGIVGGLALVAAPWAARRLRGVTLLLLVVGTVPFAVLTLTSLVTPVLAVLAWILMGLVHRDRIRPALPTSRGVRPRSAREAGTAST